MSQVTNTIDNGIQETTPVGAYPDGVSPYGCYDMAGNVFELTNTTARSYPYQANDGREDLDNQALKVIRGDGWLNHRQQARAADRPTISPRHPNDNVGARLVRGSVADEIADVRIANGVLLEE